MKNKWFWRIVFLLVFVSEVFYIVYFFSYFQIKEIKVFGNEKVKTEAVVNLVHARSIFLIDSKKITENILNNLPQIAEVKIDRQFPDRLNLAIIEREAVANFCSNDECFLLDKNGIIFEPSAGSNQFIKIFTEDGPLSNLKLGDNVLDGKTVNLILEIESKLKDDLKIAINEVRVVSEDRLNAKTIEGWEVYFNPKNDLSWQLTKLKAVLEKEIPQEKRKKLEYIDLRFGNLAPYKYR